MRALRGLGILVLGIMLASAWGCGSTATKEGTGEYVDDSVITAKVKSAIFSELDPEGQRDQRRDVQGRGPAERLRPLSGATSTRRSKSRAGSRA